MSAVVLVQGSPRAATNCPDQWGKTQQIVSDVSEQLHTSGHDVTVVDLAVVDSETSVVRPCKGCVSTAGGYHCHWPCVAENERVATTRGLIAIEDVQAGDTLTTGRVTKAWQTSPNAEWFKLQLSDGRTVRLTDNHLVKVRRRGRRTVRGREFTYEWVTVNSLRIGDHIPFPREEITFPVREDEDDSLALMAGLIFGNGTWAQDSPLWYLHESELSHLADIQDQIRQPVSIRPHSERGMTVVTWSKSDGRDLVKRFGRKNGRISPEIMQAATQSEVQAFLRGWFATDGSVSLRNGRARVTLYNKSFDCLRDAQLLLQRLGIRSSVYHGKGTTVLRGKQYARVAQLLICADALLFAKKVGFSLQKKQERVASSKPRKRTNWPAPTGQVVAITACGSGPVYDLTVATSHEFIIEGVPVHNCSCYGPGSAAEGLPDLMHDLDVYGLLQSCDAFVVVAPIHWYGPPTQVKAMFDRLVCANLTLTRDDALAVLGAGNLKNSEVTRAADKGRVADELLRNHLEGKLGCFIVHGDAGADDYVRSPKPYTYPVNEPADPRQAIMPIVWQCQYSGIRVPDDLVIGGELNIGASYSESNDPAVPPFYAPAIEALLERLS